MKVIIAGSRSFDDYELLEMKCDNILSMQDNVEIVSGTASGADKLSERYAGARGYHVTKFTANWNKEGRSAGYLRNKRMAEYADSLIAFWDGNSAGTKHMIDLAKAAELPVRVIMFDSTGVDPHKVSEDYWSDGKTKRRLMAGNAWMMCNDCGAKLYEFEGYRDEDKPCPYMRHGECEPLM